jgi:hypothetical protein
MADQQAKTRDEADNELLTAYLDGELSDTECIAVEKRLSEDPGFHNRMLELQAAWDMLDSLPMIAKPDSQFVRTTVEMAITSHRPKQSFVSGIFFKGLMLFLIPATVFGISYFSKRESIERPERELFIDLPLIENHERYTKVLFDDNAEDGIEFLRSIYNQGLLGEVGDLFAVDSRDPLEELASSTTQSPNPQLIKERSDRVSRLTEQQQAELFEKKEKFETLPEKKRKTIRKFHELLSSDPDRSNLVEALSSYYEWLINLGSSQSQLAKLLDLPLDERLVEIGRITRQQAEDAFGETGSSRLPVDDAPSFYQWYDFSIRSYHHLEIRRRTGEVFSALQLYKGVPVSEEVVERIKGGPIEQLVEFLMQHDRVYLGNLLCKDSAAGDVGIALLRELVSSEARAIIDQPEFTQRDREELILKWIEAANRSRFAIKSDTLRDYYSSLTQEQRDDLDNQHPEDRNDTLTRMYWEANIGTRSTASVEEDFIQFLRQNGLFDEFEFWEDGQ